MKAECSLLSEVHPSETTDWYQWMLVACVSWTRVTVTLFSQCWSGLDVLESHCLHSWAPVDCY